MSPALNNLRTRSNNQPLDRRASRLTWLYVSALTAVAALSLTGQLLVQHSLRQQRGDSTIVNIAGRQRMLSQKLSKAALVWTHAADEIERTNRVAEMRSTLQLWQSSHEGLQQGGRSEIVVEQFAKLQPIIDEMAATAEKLLGSETSEARQEQLRILLDREPVFLAAMDTAVFQLDGEAQDRVARLQRIEWLLLTLTLAVLVGEGLFVFRPAVQRIRWAAQELQVAKEAAESASEQKSRFLATLSHELRNPLHAILGNAELALQSPLPAEQQQRLETMQASANSLLSLVNDLLDLACIQAGKLRIQPSACDLRALAQRAVAMMQPLAARKELQISFTAPDGEFVALADSLRVQQVLLNLLGNAVKFTERGSIHLTIAHRANAIRCEIRDTGPGIRQGLQQTIFAAFTQVDADSRREVSGVGLGLAISAGLVELMRGRIGVQSEPGRGSCFWFELPVAEEALPKTEKTTAHSEPAVAPRRALIAEDDLVNQRLLVDFLQTLGHTAIVAADGRQAVAQFQKEQFDLVLLDWHMPGLDGLEVAQQLREWEHNNERQRTPIIAISAAADMAAEKVRAAGIDDLLVKPVSMELLRQALSLLRSSSVADERESGRWRNTLARLQGNWELFRDVAEIILARLPEDLRRLEQLATRRDFAELARAAHLLKGQAANFDAHELIAATEALETAVAEASAPRVAECLAQIQKAAAELRASLRQVISQFPAEVELANKEAPTK